MKKFSVYGLTIAVLLGMALTAIADDLGRVEIPAAVKLKGNVVQPGVYTFSLEKEDGKLMIHLKQSGQTVAKELAITKPAEKILENARIAYQPLRRDGKDDPVFSRVLCNWRGTLYLIYLEK
jgi:hypothetical protein